MATSPSRSREATSRRGADASLDSWKEIAAHLTRTVRTVQLWEKKHGLPVHRPGHGKLGSVYAYTDELDAWRKDGGGQPGLTDQAATGAPGRARFIGVAITAAALIGLATWQYRESRGLTGTDRPSLPGNASGVVLRKSLKPEQVWMFGRPGPHGRYLPFTDRRGDLAVFELATGKTRRLTNEGPWEKSGRDLALRLSAVSPDGDRVVYGWYTHADDRIDVRVMNLDGSGERVVYQDEKLATVLSVDWSADGRHILAHVRFRDDTPDQIVLIRVKDGSARTLKPSESREYSLSPDGRYLAYARPSASGASTSDVYLLDTATGRDTPLVQHPSNDVTPLWAADGRTLVFGSDRSGTFGVWTLRVVDGRARGSPEVILNDLGRSSLLSLTRDGTLYFELQAGTADVYIAALDPGSGRLVEGPATVGERFRGTGLSCDWSPDGRSLVYVSEHAGDSRTLRIRDVETGTEREIVPSLLSQFDKPRWSADGRSFLVKGWGPGHPSGLFRVDAETGDTERLLRLNFYQMDFTPDRKTMVYGGGSLRRVDLETGHVEKLHGPPVGNIIALSPDGRWVAFTKGGRSIQIMSVSGGEPRELRRAADNLFAQAQAWTRDGKAVLFTESTKDKSESTKLLWIPVEGGEPRETGISMPGIRQVRVHPDGRRIAFVAGWPRTELWAMENFLPEEPGLGRVAQAASMARSSALSE